jgi:hypothetical protein
MFKEAKGMFLRFNLYRLLAWVPVIADYVKADNEGTPPKYTPKNFTNLFQPVHMADPMADLLNQRRFCWT